MIELPKLFMAANWSKENEMTKLFAAGIETGVRGFDTAREYKVEKQVGKAIQTALEVTGLQREDVFIQTRICNEEILRGNIQDEVHKSLDKMGLEYIDCFMFHWPTPDYYLKAWHQLEKVYEEEKTIRSIGICNCRKRHMMEMEKECSVMPHILQVEVTPFWQIKELKEYCDEKGIEVEAFSPLCKMIKPIRENKILQDIASKYSMSIPQVILRWNVQRGIHPISLTSKVARVRSNFDIEGFELTCSEMEELSTLDCGYKYHLESATCAGF